MTWARVAATGSGAIAFRLTIPGHPYEFVTDPALVGAGTDGRTRVAGLVASSVQWSETLDPAQCRLTARGFTAEIIEDGGTLIGDSFVKQPTGIYYLASTMTSATTTMVLSNNGPANGAVLFVGHECVLVTSGGGTTSLTVTRAYRETQAYAHPVDLSVGITRPEVTTSRPSIEGLIGKLYAYGDGETGVGTRVWTGVVATQPRLRGLTTWEITLDSVMSVLDQSLSADLQDPAPLRGIYYVSSTVPIFTLSLKSGAGAYASEASSATITGTAAFYATQENFCAAITELIRVATSVWATKLNETSGAAPTLIATPWSDGSWGLVYTSAASPMWLAVESSPEAGSGPIDPKFTSSHRMIAAITGLPTASVSASTAYDIPTMGTPLVGAGTVPRGLIGKYDGVSAPLVYLGGIATAADGDGITLAWPEAHGRAERSITYTSTAWDATSRYATVTIVTTRDVGRNVRFYTRDTAPEVTISRTYATNGSFSDFVTALLAGAPEQAPYGRQPDVNSGCIDAATTTTNVTAVTAGRAWLSERTYAGSFDVNLGKLMTEEAKILAMVPSIGTDGRLIYVEFRIGAGTETEAFDVTASNNLFSVQIPAFEPSAYGLLNTITLRTGFDPLDGKHHGDTYVMRDAVALSRHPMPATMKMEPRSSYYSDWDLPFDDIVAVGQSWFGALGGSYAVTTVTCPLTALSATIGTLASITMEQLPDTANGGRGVTTLSGVVVARSVKPIAGTVELSILSSDVRIAGYAPSSRVASNALVSGTTYDVTLSLSQPTGYATASSWTVGDVVVLRQYDTTSPAEEQGTVSAVDTATRVIRVVLGAAIPAGTLNLEYAQASSIDVANANQKLYAFVATDDMINFSGTDMIARQLA